MSVSDVLVALEKKIISTKQYHRLCGTKPPEYHKVEIDEEHQKLVSLFCERHDIVLNSEFYYLGNLQREIKFALITPFGNGSTSYLGSESEQEKYKLLENLLYRIREYNHVVEFLESIDSMPYVSLQIENQGNTFDEDIDVKLFVEQGCFAYIDDIPEPGLFFLEEAVELKVPKALFCGHHDADIEDYTN